MLIHDIDSWKAGLPENADKSFTYDNFMSQQINSRYHPIDIPHLAQIMANYPDIQIVTDTKSIDKENSDLIFQTLIDEVSKVDSTILDRFIIQIYHEDMYDWVMSYYPWKSIIYTLYQKTNWTAEAIRDFALQKNIKVIGYYYFALRPEDVKIWTDAGLHVAAYTTSSLTTIEDLHKIGIDLFYTDFLTP